MKILITGIHGFIGRNLRACFINSGHELIGISKTSGSPDPFVKQYTWENLDTISGIDCIIHLAGLAHDTNNSEFEEEYYRVNTELTKTIFRFFLTSSAKTFIYFSSAKAAAGFSEIPLLETTLPSPSTVYGRSKLLAEEYILDNLPGDNRKVYILRPCMIHGPAPKGNLFSLYNYLRKGMPYPFARLANSRSYLSINNLNFIIGKLIESNIESGIYHLADDGTLSTNRIIELIGEALNKKPLMISLPSWSINALARMGTLFRLPLNTESLKKLTGNFIVSNEKIKKALNISHLPVSAEEGMRYTLKNII